jgi:low affinity Fe/Cu permease
MSDVSKWFKKFSDWVANVIGEPWVFAGAVFIILVWAGFGPVFDYSNTWQLVVNSGTTIATFLLVFLIQSAQNIENKRIHKKLNRLLKKIEELEEDD